MKPKYLMKEDSISKQGFDQEEKARKHIASGKLWFDSYDLSQLGKDKFLIDVKKVVSQSGIRLSKKNIKKLFETAMRQDKNAGYLIYIGDFVLKVMVERNPEKCYI